MGRMVHFEWALGPSAQIKTRKRVKRGREENKMSKVQLTETRKHRGEQNEQSAAHRNKETQRSSVPKE